MTGAADELPESRRGRLLAALRERRTLRTAELSSMLNVTPVTIRRDVAQLEAEGKLRRIHGGVTWANEGPTSAVILPSAAPPTTSVGMLVPSLDYYWPEVVRGAEEEARANGLRLVLRGSSYDSDEDIDQIRHLVEGPRVSGLLMAPNLGAPRLREMLSWLTRLELPAVLIERQARIPGLEQPMECVVSDHAAGAAAAVRHLVGLGHRSVGLVIGRNSPTGPYVRTGWLETLAELGLDPAATVDEKLDRYAPDFEASTQNVLDQCRDRGVTALLVHADSEAIAIVQQCHREGLSVPDDLSIVAYDDELAELYSPALTAVRPPRGSVGKAALGLVAARLSDPYRPFHRVTISPRLYLRETTAPPRS